jgi:zinc protease
MIRMSAFETVSRSTSGQASFADRTYESTVGPCRLIVLPVAVENVVSFAGSIRTSPDFGLGEDILQQLTTLTLDKGTKKRDRFAVAELIDNRGAQISFRSSPRRITFSGRSLTADLDDVLSLVAEQLREPLLASEEIEKARASFLADLRRSQENTGARASGLLSRMIYSEGHPNYSRPVGAAIDLLSAVDPSEIRAFHNRAVGADELTLVVVGDVDPAKVECAVREVFADWHSNERVRLPIEAPAVGAPREQIDTMPEKSNADVRFGHAIAIRRDHPDYLPLYVGGFVLGGNFSSRLMSTVRDQMGLTYGISASIVGTSVEYAGNLRIGVTLSPDNFDRGVEATREVTSRTILDGVAGEEVAAARETIAGSFVVDLGTTGGLAYSLLINHLRGFGTGYLDHFREEIHAITTEQVNDSLRTHLNPDALNMAASGSVPDIG